MTPLGVDLGTTNLVAAWVDPQGEARVLYDGTGNALVPATILFDSPHSVEIGHDPLVGESLDIPNLAVQTKRWLGRPRAFVFHEREYSAVELASLMLRKLVDLARERVGDEIGPVTLAIPAHFDVAQRAALHQVAQLAEVKLHDIVSEPVAAGLAFGTHEGGDLYRRMGDGIPTLVLDLGGGTFDISVVTCTAQDIHVPVVTGDDHLGGMDFDRAIYYRLCHHLWDAAGIDPAEHPEIRFRLLARARQAKETLTYNPTAHIEVPAEWIEGKVVQPLRLTAIEAAVLWEELLARAERVLDRALAEAETLGLDIGRVVFSGGGSLVPAFRARMLARLGQIDAAADPLMGPDEAVAIGAALYGQMSHPRPGAHLEPLPALHEHLPYDLGVADDVGHLVVVVPKGARLPASGIHVFTTIEDRQEEVVFRIVRRDADGEVTHLGELGLNGLPPLPQGAPDLHVRFQVDAQGALAVTAWEGDNKPVKLHVAFSGDLTALRPARRGKQLIVR